VKGCGGVVGDHYFYILGLIKRRSEIKVCEVNGREERVPTYNGIQDALKCSERGGSSGDIRLANAVSAYCVSDSSQDRAGGFVPLFVNYPIIICGILAGGRMGLSVWIMRMSFLSSATSV